MPAPGQGCGGFAGWGPSTFLPSREPSSEQGAASEQGYSALPPTWGSKGEQGGKGSP